MDYSSTMRPKAGGMTKGAKGSGPNRTGYGDTEGTIGSSSAPMSDHETTHDAAKGTSNANSSMKY